MIYLREISENDLPLINKWRNDVKLISLLGTPFRHINLETDFEWFQNYLKNRDTQVRCAIIDEKTDHILGIASLTGINHINKNCEFHIMIGDNKNRNKGVGTIATQKMVEHAFRNLNMHKIWLTVLEHNISAIKVYEKIGFKKEGLLKEAVFKEGRFRNLFYMALLESEYKFK